MWHSSRAAMFVPVPSFLPPKRFPIPMVLVLTLLSEWRLFLFGRLLLCTARQLRAEPSPPLVKVSVFSFSFMSALLTFMLSLLCGCSHLHWIIFQHPLFLTGPSELPCQLRHTHWCSPPCFSYCRSAAELCCREALCGWGSRYIRGRTGRFLFFCLNFWRFYSVFMNLYKKKKKPKGGASATSLLCFCLKLILADLTSSGLWLQYVASWVLFSTEDGFSSCVQSGTSLPRFLPSFVPFLLLKGEMYSHRLVHS